MTKLAPSSAVRWLGVAVVPLLFGLAVVSRSGGFEANPSLTVVAVPTAPAATANRAPAISNASCSASACHGAPATDTLRSMKPLGPIWNCSASVWQATDPHSGTYSLLTDKPYRSVKATAKLMIERLGPGWTEPATREVRCLACHTDPANASAIPNSLRAKLHNDGVGCQACHGDATGWLTSHTAGASLIANLKNIGIRAETCAGCHIGAPASPSAPLRDVNHDMIAAGHPRLTYDFAEHHRRLPKHWNDSARRSQEPNFELRLWLVGQAVEAEAVCRLAAERTKGVGPELADYRCTACHHSIPGTERLDVTRPLGQLPWRSAWAIRNDPKISVETETLARRALGRNPPTACDWSNIANALRIRRNILLNRPDTELPSLFQQRWSESLPPADGEDLVAQLQAKAAQARNGQADQFDFDGAYERARAQKWKALSDALGKAPGAAQK